MKKKTCKVIAISNFKGGVGKTTTAIDLAAAFVKLGKKVLAIDSDGQGHLTIGFGFSKSSKGLLYIIGIYYPSGNIDGKYEKNVIPDL